MYTIMWCYIIRVYYYSHNYRIYPNKSRAYINAGVQHSKVNRRKCGKGSYKHLVNS